MPRLKSFRTAGARVVVVGRQARVRLYSFPLGGCGGGSGDPEKVEQRHLHAS